MASVVTNLGKAIATNLLSGLGGTAPNYVAIGSGAGTAGVTDTTLFTEYVGGTWSGYARLNTTPTRITTSVTNDTVSWQSANFTAPSAQVVTNCGLFDAATVGNLFCKSDFAVSQSLGTGESLNLKFTLQFN